ncbi:MAG: c-type cytochrome [Gemmataceae bacterium]
MHRVVVTFFQGGGEAELEVSVAGPGLSTRPLGELIADSEEGLKGRPAVKLADDDSVDVKPELAAKGKALFAALGCASCHAMKADGKPVESTVRAPGLDRLTANNGCLAEQPRVGLPRYDLDEAQRKAIVAGLAGNPPAATPQAVIEETMTRFNCYACHVRDRVGGPPETLNAAFQTTQPEMGDEGRLPPPLDGIGAKLQPDYFRMLLDRGVHDRPYMHTRMPGFGLANVEKLPAAFAALDRLPATPPVALTEPPARVKATARHLVSGQAFGCIKCHTFAGHKAEGVQGIDMVLMPKRLRRDWFHAYATDPQKTRPGTRMPAAFINGKSVLPDYFDGTARTQLEAIWQYLEDGPRAQVPPGMGKTFLPLVPTTGAILYRNFIEGAGTRAIGVGYPEKVNLAFDANELRPALLWHGAFIDAARHWTDRGAGTEGPLGDNVLKLPAGVPFARLDRGDTPWPTASARTQGYRFRGLSSPSRRLRPTFRVAEPGWRSGEFYQPSTRGKNVTLRRTFTEAAEKPNDDLTLRAAVGGEVDVARRQCRWTDSGRCG